MQAPELTNTQALIDRYYTEEKMKKAQALTRATLNLQLDANDLAMLSTIAKRFGKSRDELAKDVLSNALIDLLTQLEPGERKLIARDADEMGSSMAREIAEENGVKDIEHKPNVWTGHDRTISKAEKKRAKELEDARKAEKNVQKSAHSTTEVQASTAPKNTGFKNSDFEDSELESIALENAELESNEFESDETGGNTTTHQNDPAIADSAEHAEEETDASNSSVFA